MIVFGKVLGEPRLPTGSSLDVTATNTIFDSLNDIPAAIKTGIHVDSSFTADIVIVDVLTTTSLIIFGVFVGDYFKVKLIRCVVNCNTVANCCTFSSLCILSGDDDIHQGKDCK